MNLMVDAQLPRRLCRLLASFGHTAIHTLDLPQQNRTDDDAIMQYADTHDCAAHLDETMVGEQRHYCREIGRHKRFKLWVTDIACGKEP